MAEGSSFIQLYEKYGKEYFDWFVAALVNPRAMVAATRNARAEHRLGSYMLVVLGVSVFLGATIGALIPGRPPLQGRVVVFVVVSLLWTFIGVVVHGVCRAMGGKEEADVSVSLTIQALAFVYVVSNFLTFLIVIARLQYKPLEDLLADRMFFQKPGDTLFTIQFIGLLYLVPATVAYAHMFRGYKWVVVAILAATFSVGIGIPVSSAGGC